MTNVQRMESKINESRTSKLLEEILKLLTSSRRLRASITSCRFVASDCRFGRSDCHFLARETARSAALLIPSLVLT